ncbi:MAG: PorV/PorQ family protein [candidate division KSB1 bacterium]|nr:PorV/PorQ family protein [candidate division KSB1 bacterium]
MNRTFLLFFLPLFFTCTIGWAQNGAGYHGAEFLSVHPSARRVALGDAVTAIPHDINAVRYNIGAVGGLRHTLLTANFHKWIDDTQQGSLAFGYPQPWGVIAGGLSYFDEGEIQRMDQDFFSTGETIQSGDMMLSLGYGNWYKTERFELDFGVSFSYMHQNLAGETSNAAGMDLGMQLHIPYVSFGAAVQNISLNKVQFDTYKTPLPRTIRTGITGHGKIYNALTGLLSSDLIWIRDQDASIHLGAEIIYNQLLALRGGYSLSGSRVTPWALGFGLYIPAEWLNNSLARIDYAYAPIQTFESSAHRFSIHFAMNKLKTQKYDLSGIRQRLQSEIDQAQQARMKIEEEKEAAQKLLDQINERLAKIQEIADSDNRIEIVPDKSDRRTLTVVMKQINFDFNKWEIKPEYFNTMHNIADILKTYPEAQVQVSGHTDSIGTDPYNIRLSHKRVNRVISFLNEQEDIPENKFFMPVGYGELRPIASNATPEGRAENRRVEFKIFSFDKPPKVPKASAVFDVLKADETSVKIQCNGKTDPKVNSLSDPPRVVLDLSDVYIMADKKVIPLNTGPFQQARLGFHSENRFTRVVLDLERNVKIDVKVIQDYIIVNAD